VATRETVDALIVGAGPAGGQTALELAERGHRVLLVEDDPVVGVPMQCAGLVTPRLFRIVRFPMSDVVINRIRGAVIYSPGGRRLELDAGGTHAVVMDRVRLDQRIGETAVDAGVQLWTRTHFETARRDNGGVLATVTRRDEAGREGPVEVKARLLVGADGVQSNVGRLFGLPRPAELLPGYEAEMDGLRLPRDDTIPVFTDPRLAPGFFSWIIPVSRTVGRAGLCMQMRRRSAQDHFDAFVRHDQVRPYLTEAARVTKPIVGTVPVGLCARYTADRVMLVGDAAGMAKPSSGGGIYTGLEGALVCADVADRALRSGRTDASFLRRYEARFNTSRIGREIRIGWRLRRAFLSMSEADLEEAFRLLTSRRATAVLDRFGDIDHPSHLLLPLFFAEPRLARFLPKALRAALRGRAA
jgi:digeranylgeranylglycerophospholipid reductase